MSWVRQTINKPTELKAASDILHQAAQFIPMAARHFIKEEADDSHTNAEWIRENNWLIGNKIDTPYGNIHVGLDYPLLVLLLCNENLEPIAEIELIGKTRLEAFNWLNNQLWKLGLETENFNSDLHYELPDHPILHGSVFEMETPRHFLELANYRSNGHALLSYATENFKDKSSIKIWPHHFDEGIIVNLKKEGDKVVSLLSIGMAIADKYYDQPYFYVNAWKERGVDYKELPEIKGSGHWHQYEWTGQVLTADKFAAIIDHKEQEELCKVFMKSAIENAITLLE